MHSVVFSCIVSSRHSNCGVLVNTVIRCLAAGPLLFGCSPYCSSSALLCLAVHVCWACMSQYTIFCMVDL